MKSKKNASVNPVTAWPIRIIDMGSTGVWVGESARNMGCYRRRARLPTMDEQESKSIALNRYTFSRMSRLVGQRHPGGEGV